MKFRIALAALALLVFGMSGVASAQSTGDLVFVHGIPGGPSVNLTVKPQGGGADIAVGTVLAGDSIRKALPPGTHTLVVVIPALNDATLNQPFTIAAGSTTTVKATLEGTAPKLTVTGPVAETSTARPQTVTVPTRVETGAGGTAADGALELVLGGVAAAVVLGGLTLGLRRRTTA